MHLYSYTFVYASLTINQKHGTLSCSYRSLRKDQRCCAETCPVH
jgi:hypothetical protein